MINIDKGCTNNTKKRVRSWLFKWKFLLSAHNTHLFCRSQDTSLLISCAPKLTTPYLSHLQKKEVSERGSQKWATNFGPNQLLFFIHSICWKTIRFQDILFIHENRSQKRILNIFHPQKWQMSSPKFSCSFLNCHNFSSSTYHALVFFPRASMFNVNEHF